MYGSLTERLAARLNTQSSPAERFQIRTREQLRQFVWERFGARIPDTHICEGHDTPWEAFCDAYFAGHSMAVWEASRGFGGKSYMLALLGVTEAATLGADVSVLGGSGEQSINVHGYMQTFWQYAAAPVELLASDPIKRETRLTWGNKVTALLASQTSVRGPHPQRLRLDEVDEMDLEVFKASMGQTMKKRGVPAQTVMSSTHQHAEGTMTQVLKLATQRGWPIYRWCYRESMAGEAGWLDAGEIDRKRNEVTEVMWDTEYELQEPNPESRAISPEKVAIMFKKELGEYAMPVGTSQVFEPYDPAGLYATGADWAKERDLTVIITLRVDVTPMRVVAFGTMGRLPWPIMTDAFDDRIVSYGGTRRRRQYACHDNTGVGDVVADYMESDAEGVDMVGRRRTELLSTYITAIEHELIIAPFIGLMEEEHRTASVAQVYGGKHLPDTISAGAMAYRAAQTVLSIPRADVVEDLGHIDGYNNQWGGMGDKTKWGAPGGEDEPAASHFT